jgi:hypothetical protein
MQKQFDAEQLISKEKGSRNKKASLANTEDLKKLKKITKDEKANKREIESKD